ncbi:hypothetical protein ACSHXN_45340 (plasmid) [Streptomyces sp. HUAS TT11]|uniref:hypothetical protein n=1 Tax=Streptomyces sp. HUAS TT11 TaxID=3447508 RepID=UPI003F65A567
MVIRYLRTEAETLTNTDQETGEVHGDPYEPTADLLNGVAWAFHQRLVGSVPVGEDPEGPIDAAELREVALQVTAGPSHDERAGGTR